MKNERPFEIGVEVYYELVVGKNRTLKKREGEVIDAFYQEKNKPYGRREGWRCMVSIGWEFGERITIEKYWDELTII